MSRNIKNTRSWSSYRSPWPVFAVLALIAIVAAVVRPGAYQTVGAVALAGAAVVACLRGRREG
jgi:hypothetical protein